MTDLRAALFGLGQMGRHHARALGALAGVELVAVHDPQAPDTPGLPRVSSPEELLARHPDFAVVATPTGTHLELGRMLAAAGIHALIEKPISSSTAEARELTELFERAGLVAGVGHIERYNPALRELRRRLDENQLGELYQVSTRRTGPFPTRIGDVGVVLDLATHDVDLTAWVTRAKYESVTAHTAHRSGRQHEDLVSAIATLDNGVVVNHSVNWLSPLKERVTVLTGERGSLVADTLSMDLTYYANGVAPVEWEAVRSFRGVVQGDVVRYAIPKPEPLAVELEAFRDAVLGQGTDIVSLGAATQVVAVAEAMLRSARDGTTQRV